LVLKEYKVLLELQELLDHKVQLASQVHRDLKVFKV
jgi:hypothetical protein